MGGGGKNTVTQSSGVPEWLKPDVQRAFGEATSAHQAGDLGQVAALAPGQTEFLSDTANQGISGHAQRLLDNAEGGTLAGQANTGSLSSARGDALRANQRANLAGQLATQDLQARNQAYGQIQDQKQRQLDSRHQGLQRLFGYYGSGAAGTQQTQSGGGGK